MMLGGDKNNNDAEDSFLEAFSLRNENTDANIQHQLLHNIIILFTRTGRYDEALEKLEQKKILGFSENGNSEEELRHRINTIRDEAKIRFELGEYDCSRSLYLEAISLAEEIDWLRMVSYFYFKLASISLKAGDLDRAERYLHYGSFIAEKIITNVALHFL
jgi:tetratricopeptide (TPR) repeat protein